MNRKVAFVFPGQGSQQVGMGKDFYYHYAGGHAIFEEASQTAGFDLSSLCFSGPEERLRQTTNAQLAILTVSIAGWQILAGDGVSPQMVAGHSSGEYAALVVAGVLDFSSALKLIFQRAQFMSEVTGGTMAAILGLPAKKVEEICAQGSEWGVVEPANYNCPGQTVISGEKEAVEQAMVLSRAAGARKVIPLRVSGPFHSSLMQIASEKLTREIENYSFTDPHLPVLSNVTGDYLLKAEQIKSMLVKQVRSPVRWEESVRRMINDGVNMFVEIGPGKVLSGLIQRIDSRMEVLNVEDEKSLQETLKNLRQ